MKWSQEGKGLTMKPEDIKQFIDDERRRQRFSQEQISEAADLPDLAQSYQRFLKRPRGNMYTMIKLLDALGYVVEIIQKGG